MAIVGSVGSRGTVVADLWVMSEPIAFSPNAFGLKRTARDQSPVPASTPRLTPSRQLRRVSFPKSVPNLAG